MPQQQHNYTPSPPAVTPLSLIVNKHTTAIHVLTHGRLPPAASSDPVQQTALRQYTTSIIQSFGWSWPAILDADYPPPNDSPDGLRYERVILE